MKILYAVQATGNGHITRARIMAKAFKELNIQADWVFSGRAKDELFDMEAFGQFRVFPGLTFVIKNGSINYLKTAFKNNLFKFVRDIFSFDFTGYDLVLNDFEPITAWAAKLRGIKNIGISHQMAFRSKIPTAGKNLIAQTVLKYFSPVSIPIGLHWDHFEQNLLPPIIEQPTSPPTLNAQEILVYYPFCDAKQLVDWFAPFKDFNFHIFHGENTPTGHPHIKLYNFSRSHFQSKQYQCAGVITAAGFELPSEAIQLGQKLLILPLENQMEQQSNAKALEQIGRATSIKYFSNQELELWLQKPTLPPLIYPNVASEMAKWLVSSERESLKKLSRRLWAETNRTTSSPSKISINNKLNHIPINNHHQNTPIE
ncbi:MJ1255/VC2487 family glycosyltransferase [Aliikangiella sp. IMCC44359]|uniref:MJ1255/VC2487 family glycosyltransferase n=1 Tax=Aliikangiella sp. IMCC44359 TaxID=3459125 RepID=UPI00403B2573